MNKWKLGLMVLGLAATPLLAAAAGTPQPAPAPKAAPAASDEPPAPPAGVTPDRSELERQLEDARRQMDEAARRMAQLSMQLNGDAMRNVTVMRERLEKLRHRGFLGIDLDDDAQGAGGVTVSGVTPGGPADKAGLRDGDVIQSINGTVFKASGDDSASDKLVDFMRGTKPGDNLKIGYSRDGKSATTTATAGSLNDVNAFYFNSPEPPEPPMPPGIAPVPPVPPVAPRGLPFNMFFGMGSRWGEMQLVPMTVGLGQYFGTDRGLLVLHVPKDSALQLQEGDVIMQLGGRDPGTPPHAMRILSSYGPGESVKIDIMRKGKPQTLNVTLPKSREDDTSNAFNFSFGDDDDYADSR